MLLANKHKRIIIEVHNLNKIWLDRCDSFKTGTEVCDDWNTENVDVCKTSGQDGETFNINKLNNYVFKLNDINSHKSKQ